VFKWVTVQGPSASQITTPTDFQKLGAIPEKALKGRALSNQTEYGLQEATRPFTKISTTEQYGGKPFVEFKFKYRSRRTYTFGLCFFRRTNQFNCRES
jgi:hypothetical protein